jgi:hypothetical protein
MTESRYPDSRPSDPAGIAAYEADIRSRGGQQAIAEEYGFDFSGYWPTCRQCGAFCPSESWAIHAAWHANATTLDLATLAGSIRSRTEPLSAQLPPNRYISSQALNALADALERLGSVDGLLANERFATQ